MRDPLRVFIGYDPTEALAYEVAQQSLRDCTRAPVVIRQISRLIVRAVYTRPTSLTPQGQLWDEISQAPMSTDHAIARFFVPWLCDYHGWALFVDGDVLFRRDVADLFDRADDRLAVLCVQHPPLPERGEKKDGAPQIPYPRKNWSSVMLFNCGHPAHQSLTLDRLNRVPGRDLHAFCWLSSADIGALPPEWNYLAGVNPLMDNPAIVHYTLGVPTLPGHHHDPHADEWRGYAVRLGLLPASAAQVDVPV